MHRSSFPVSAGAANLPPCLLQILVGTSDSWRWYDSKITSGSHIKGNSFVNTMLFILRKVHRSSEVIGNSKAWISVVKFLNLVVP